MRRIICVCIHRVPTEVVGYSKHTTIAHSVARKVRAVAFLVILFRESYTRTTTGVLAMRGFRRVARMLATSTEWRSFTFRGTRRRNWHRGMGPRGRQRRVGRPVPRWWRGVAPTAMTEQHVASRSVWGPWYARPTCGQTPWSSPCTGMVAHLGLQDWSVMFILFLGPRLNTQARSAHACADDASGIPCDCRSDESQRRVFSNAMARTATSLAGRDGRRGGRPAVGGPPTYLSTSRKGATKGELFFATLCRKRAAIWANGGCSASRHGEEYQGRRSMEVEGGGGTRPGGGRNGGLRYGKTGFAGLATAVNCLKSNMWAWGVA